MSNLIITPKMLVVFIDETGNEDFSDPKFPVFGRGACAILGCDYKNIIEKPWRRLKREHLGGAEKPFHAVEFGQLPPKKAQIYAINSFLKGKFYRFFSMDHLNSNRPENIDGHQTVTWAFQERLRKIARKLDIDSVVLIFESSTRVNRLVERDFILEKLNIINVHGNKMEIDGCFMEKKLMMAGLEVADLIVHTAGRQARKMYSQNFPTEFNLDYEKAFHSIQLGLADGIFIHSVQLS